MKELQRIHADVVTVILDQPFLFHADPAVVLERVAALEKVGFGNDVGEIVTKQPSLLALPVSVHTGPAPARARRRCTVWLPLGRNPPVRHRIQENGSSALVSISADTLSTDIDGPVCVLSSQQACRR